MRNFFMCLALLCTGCSHLPSHVWYQDSQELISDKQYRKAIEQLQSETPINYQKVSLVKQQANRYRISQLSNIERLIRLKEWAMAQTRLNQLIETQPWHSSFSLTQNKLDKSKNEEKRLLDTKQTIAQANLVKAQIQMENFNQREQPFYRKIFSNSSSLEEDKKAIAKKLFELSVAALAVQDYHNAQKTYAQALSLDSELKASLLSDAIEIGVYQRNQETISLRQKRLISQLKQAIKLEDFPTIIRIQGILSKPPFEGKAVARVLNKANKKRTSSARALDQQADNVYREGNIKAAIELWKEARNLAPDLLGIQDKLARAIKVQKKLAKLRQNQP